MADGTYYKDPQTGNMNWKPSAAAADKRDALYAQNAKTMKESGYFTDTNGAKLQSNGNGSFKAYNEPVKPIVQPTAQQTQAPQPSYQAELQALRNQQTAYQTQSTADAKTAQQAYQDQLTAYQTQVAQAAAAAKQFALKQAWEGNTQALNSQNATVGNNFNSAKNNLNALQASRTPEYQAQKDATSQEAAAQMRRTQALNAMTGNYNSGYNRSQMNDVGLARQASLGAIGGAENTFNDSVSNQISSADASRVAALNDIAGKLSLGQQQYNDGTLNLNTQLASDVATGSLQASLQAQEWSDRMTQQGIDNSSRDAQLALSTQIANAQTAYQNGQLTMQQYNSDVANAVAAAGVTGRIPDYITTKYPSSPVSQGSGTTYGLAEDVARNPGAKLYVPGVTQMKVGDVFLGGTGTGVTDAQLNGATRIAGQTAQDTQNAYNSYNSGGSASISSLPSAIASQYPGATNIKKTGNSYSFTYNGSTQWYYQQ